MFSDCPVCIYLLVMPKYWGKQIFSLGSFAEVGQMQMTEKKERKRERLNDGNNNGQATHGARKPPGPINLNNFLLHTNSI